MDGRGVMVGNGEFVWMADYQKPGAWVATLSDGTIVARGEARNIHHAIALFRLGGDADGNPHGEEPTIPGEGVSR